MRDLELWRGGAVRDLELRCGGAVRDAEGEGVGRWEKIGDFSG